MTRTVSLALFLCTLFSCETDKRNTAAYFDTKSFFEKAALKLSIQQKALKKELVFGDSSVTQQFDRVDWKKELQPFAEIDLQKNGYKGRFKVDTIQNGNQRTITYTSEDPKTDLKELMITLKHSDHSLQYLKARFGTTNTLYEASKELVYYTDSLFTIKGAQQVRLGNNLIYTVTGKITEGQ